MFYAINFWKVGDISFFQFFFWRGEGGEIILDNFLFFKDSFFYYSNKAFRKSVFACVYVKGKYILMDTAGPELWDI